MAHQAVIVDAIRFRHQNQAGRIFVVRLIAQIHQHGQLFGVHLLGNRLQQFRWGCLVRQRRDDNIRAFAMKNGPGLYAALTCFIHLPNISRRRNDLRIRRIVRPLNMGHQICVSGLWAVEQMHTGADDFIKVVRWDVRCHTHGNTRAPIEQNKRCSGGQQARLLNGAVEVWIVIYSTLASFGQQQICIARQARFGIAHGSK